MDPITAGLAIGGFALQAFGAFGASSAAAEQSRISKEIAGQEREINMQKYQAMVLQSRRQQLEVARNAQRARAQSVQAATTQGAQFGSGLQTGLGQVTSDAASNSLGISQNQEIGQNIFGFNNNISGLKSQMASAQSAQATAQGLSSLGGSLIQNSGTIGALGKNIGSGFGDPFAGYGGSSRWSFGSM